MPFVALLACAVAFAVAAQRERIPWLPWLVLAAYAGVGALVWTGYDGDQDGLVRTEVIGGGLLVLVGIVLGYGWAGLRHRRP
jgi:hypothetical protein